MTKSDREDLLMSLGVSAWILGITQAQEGPRQALAMLFPPYSWFVVAAWLARGPV